MHQTYTSTGLVNTNRYDNDRVEKVEGKRGIHTEWEDNNRYNKNKQHKKKEKKLLYYYM